MQRIDVKTPLGYVFTSHVLSFNVF